MADQIKVASNPDLSSGVFINDVEILERDIAKEMQHHTADTMDESKFYAAQALVIRELLLQRAATLELDKDLTPMENESEEEALIRILIEKEVNIPSDDEESCRRYFESNRERFQTSPLVEASHILIAAAPDDDNKRDKAKSIAQAVVQRLVESPDSFAALAKEHSSCPSAEVGGSLGQLSKGQTVPEFEKVLFATQKIGLIERPIESRYGIHVVRMDHFEPGMPLEFDMVEKQVKMYLRETVHRKGVSQYITHLAGEADIKGITIEAGDGPLVQ